MALQLTAAGTSVACFIESISFDEKIDDPATCSFDVPDSVGYSLTQNQIVQVTDTVTSILLYSGFVEKVADVAFPGNLGIRMRAVTCKGNRWRAEKRYWTGPEFNGWTGGDIAAELHRTVLASEGVTAAYALDHDYDTTTFGQGTLTGVVAANNVLTLAQAGTDYTRTDAVTADFASGALTNVAAASNALSLTSSLAVKYSGSVGASLDANNLFCFRKIWAGSYTLASLDEIRYDLWVASSSPEIKVGLDLLFSDGTWLHDFITNFQDQYVIPLDPSQDLKGWADDQWDKRVCQVPAVMAGKVVSAAYLVMQGNKGGDYTAYFKNVKVTNAGGGTTRVSIFAGADTTMHANVPSSVNGYFNVKAIVTTVYEHDGARVAPSRDITSVGIVRASVINWVATTPTQPSGAGTYLPQVLIEASVDGGATYQACTNHAPIPGLIVGMNTSGRGVIIRQTLAVGGPNPEFSPKLTYCSFTVYSAAAATKTDFVDIDNDQTSLGLGVLTNCTSYTDGLRTTGQYRDWDNLVFSSQTLYGVTVVGAPQQGAGQRNFFLRTDTGADVRSRFDFAGQWTNFILEMDIHLVLSTGSYGVVYRCSGWQDTNDTYAYVADINATSVNLGHGTNTGSGGGAHTTIVSIPLTLTVGAWYRMKIVVNGNNHRVFLNDFKFIDANDSTWTGGGYVGARFYNNTGARNSGHYDNFGIIAYESDEISVSSRVTPSLALSGIVGDSRVNWQADVPSSSILVVESTIDGGSTYQTCTNGAQIPLLVPGYNAAGKSVKFRFSMNNQAINLPISLQGYSAFVIGAYSASGTRVSPALAIDAAGTIGSSSVTWQATQPTGTGVAVATSPDNVTYTGIAASGNPVAGLVAQGAMTADDFDVNSAANYTATFWTGGAAPVFTVDTANSRMRVTSGTNGIILWNTAQFPTAKDVYLELVSNQVDVGGLVWRYTDVNNCYYAVLRDTSSGASPNTIAVRKRVTSTDTQIIAPTAIPTFTRTTSYHTLKVTMVGTTITVYFDGVQIAQVTDTSLSGPGQVGLYQSSATASQWYSVRAQKLGDSAASKSVYSKLTLTSTDPAVAPSVLSLVTSVRGPDLMTGALIASTQYAYTKKGSEIMADVSSQSKMYWRIDKNIKLVMRDRAYTPAPWPLYSADPLFLGTRNPPKLTHSSPMYRNRQFVTGAIDLQSVTESKTGDATTQSWALKYPVDSISSLTLDGNPQTVGVQGVDTGKQWYYQPGQPTLSQDSSGTPPTNQQMIAITYVARVPYTSMRESTAQQTALAAVDGTSGIVEASEDCGGLSKAAADTLAQSRIDEYAILSVDWDYSTSRGGLAPGQLQTIFVPEHSLNDTDVLISAIHTSIWSDVNGTLQYTYDVTSTSGPNVGTWQRLFAQ